MSGIKSNTLNSNLTVLTKDTGWYGGHSGFYERLGKILQDPPIQAKVTKPKKTLTRKVIGRLNSIRVGMPDRNAHVSSAELEFFLRLRFLKNKCSCILNMDDHWPLLNYWNEVPRSLVGVIHLPTSQWTTEDSQWTTSSFEMCKKLRSAVVLWEREIPIIEEFVGAGRVAFVPHGIDTTFFHPGNEQRKKMSFLSCGQYLRDFDMLKSAFLGIQKTHPESELRIIIPERFLEVIDLSWTEQNTNVSIISGLSDEELRSEYQQTTALLMPFTDSGANNAVMEAMACGCPIVTNDIGGIRSYGGGSIYPVGEDADELVEIALKLIDDPAWALEMSQKLRSYSLTFEWDKVVDLFLSTTQQLALE
jgi:glycosyltransferase involved in cell wall biosynthesis